MDIEKNPGSPSSEFEKEVRKQLHDMSNTLTILVGRAELLTKSDQLSESDRKELEEIVSQGYICFQILEKARNVFKRAA